MTKMAKKQIEKFRDKARELDVDLDPRIRRRATQNCKADDKKATTDKVKTDRQKPRR